MTGQQYENDEKLDTKKGAAAGKGKGSAKGGSSGGVVSGGHGAIISTAFTNMRTVSAFSMQHKVSQQYAAVTHALAEKRVGRSKVAGFAFGGGQASTFLTYALLMWYGGTLIKSGDVSFLNLMTAIMTLMLGALGLGNALSDLGDQKAGMECAARIFKAIDEAHSSPIDGLSPKGVVPADKAVGHIELSAINFRYPTRLDMEVCKDFTLDIQPGEMVALVGPSGSGKSTIISLLQRFYDPLSGVIKLDGVDTKQLNVRWLRSQIGFVGQEPVLFQGSIADNIAKGRTDAIDEPVMSLEQAMRLSDDSAAGCAAYFSCCLAHGTANPPTATAARARATKVPTSEDVDIEMGQRAVAKGSADPDIIEACVASNAHDFISGFTQGYDTDIGEGSIMVSGGQKQRIAIARALIKKPAILLLDEATSALDASSERVVQASIDALQSMKAQTTIVIAHRLSTIRSADKIIVVDKGVVVEVGTHDELLAKAGLYAQLWAKQSGTDAASNKRAALGKGASSTTDLSTN